VVADGYCGSWMTALITTCRGHHEPQEEVAFAEVMRHIGERATMIELGGYWSFYSIWFKRAHEGRRGIVVEPDPAHLRIGMRNASINACELEFVNAVAAGRDQLSAPFETEESGVVELPRVSVPGLMSAHGVEVLDVLHCDAQGVELEIIESCREPAAEGRLNWVVVSTHTHHISGDPLTHQRCLAALDALGATVLAEHDVHESFSGDGLIVAKFGEVPSSWISPPISFNRYSHSLFRNPLYELASELRRRA
jgi:FkbM family methyltransferase